MTQFQTSFALVLFNLLAFWATWYGTGLVAANYVVNHMHGAVTFSQVLAMGALMFVVSWLVASIFEAIVAGIIGEPTK